MSNYKNEFDYLIHLLKCVLTDEKPDEKPDSISFKRLFKLARDHSVANMAFYAVEQLSVQPEEPLLSEWSQLRDKDIVKDITQLSELEMIGTAFAEAGVRFLPLKGCILKNYYPQSDMRTMSDIDILIDEENAAKVRDVLSELGYSCEEFGIDVHDVYFKPPVMNVEVHRQFFGTHGQEFIGVFDDAFAMCSPPEGSRYSFTDECFFAYILSHTAKHYNDGGTGIRSIMDIWVYMKAKGASLNAEKACSMLDGSGLGELVRDFIKLSQIWFDGAEGTEKYQKMTGYILSSGTYGTIENSVENRVQNGGKLHYLFRAMFPDFFYMKQTYPVLQKAPVLLPFCWLARLITKPLANRKETAEKLRVLMKRKKK